MDRSLGFCPNPIVNASFHSVAPSSNAKYRMPINVVTLLSRVAVMFELLVKTAGFSWYLELSTSDPVLLFTPFHSFSSPFLPQAHAFPDCHRTFHKGTEK